jgi:hypothetical protein
MRQTHPQPGTRPLVELLERRALLSTGAAAPLPGTPATDAAVAGRYVFFNHSAFDANDPAANASDDSAVAPAIAPLLPAQTASAANVSSYSRGLNGVMIDVAHLARDVSAADFRFRVGSDGTDPATWPIAPSPSSITVRRGAGVGGSDRVSLTWPDGVIQNTWLQVTVLDTLNTGLPVPDTFAFATLPGASGASGATAVAGGPAPGIAVTRLDLLATRRRLTGRRPVGLDSPLDHNRDGRVNALDVVVVRHNLLSRIGLPPAPLQPPAYYVSPAGDDTGDGLSPLSAWRTVAKVNSTALPPGAHVLFERGGEWHEQLSVSSSGTPDAPVVFGSYGSGLKPKFWGSDPLDAAAFEPVEGTASTWRMVLPAAPAVNSIQANHAFFHSTYLLLRRSSDPASNRARVDSTPDSWYQDGSGVLYVNTGGIDPRAAGAPLYTASVRENVVLVEHQHDVMVRNLVVDETATANGGYAFAFGRAENITAEGCEAYRAGRHHFGAINANHFTGRELYSAWAMPDLGYGGASAYVSYSDDAGPIGLNSWIDCTYDEVDGAVAPYLNFYTHGPTQGDVLVQNIVSRGGIGLSATTHGADQRVLITGGTIEDAGVTLYTDNAVVDGLTLRGPRAGVTIVGANNTFQNLLVDGALPNFGAVAAVIDYGRDTTFRFNTIRLDPATPGYAAALVGGGGGQNGVGARVYGNIIDAGGALAVRQDGDANWPSVSDDNLFAREPTFMLPDRSTLTLPEWRAASGKDVSSIVASPLFADAPAGNFTLLPGSPGLDAFAATDLLAAPPTDILGNPRPRGPAADLGAFEAP